MPHRVFNLQEVAAYLHVEAADVEALVRQGEIPVECQGGRRVFRKKEVDAWASQRILGLSEKRLTDFHRRSSSRVRQHSRREALMPDLLKPDFIEPDLHSKTRASVLRDMVALADRTDRLCDAEGLLTSLDERERLCSTGMPGGVALLHPRHHDPYMFQESFLVLGRTIQRVHFGAPDDKPTDLFFLLCCQDDELHLHVLARLCVLCLKTEMLSRLRGAVDAGAMCAAVLACENQALLSL